MVVVRGFLGGGAVSARGPWFRPRGSCTVRRALLSHLPITPWHRECGREIGLDIPPLLGYYWISIIYGCSSSSSASEILLFYIVVHLSSILLASSYYFEQFLRKNGEEKIQGAAATTKPRSINDAGGGGHRI